MTPPRVSVLMPTWNRARLLETAIRSVLDQSFRDLELIVVDDGSTDSTGDVLARIGDDRLRPIRQEHSGISAALNRGLGAARGEVIARLDSDDLWLADMLEAEMAVLDARPDIDVVHARAEAIDADGNVIREAEIRGQPERFPGEPFRSMLYADFTCNITTLARRRCYDVVGGYDESLPTSEDWDLWLRMARHFRFAFLDRVVARFRNHEANVTSVTSPLFEDFVNGRVKVIDKVFNAPDLDPSLLALRAVSYRNVHSWTGAMFLNVGEPRKAAWAFWRSLAAGDDLAVTLARIAWLTLSLGVLAKHPVGRRLVDTATRVRKEWQAWRRASRGAADHGR